MPHRDFDDLDSAGVPLDATREQMVEWIEGAIAHRKEQSKRLSAIEATQADLKDGHQVLWTGQRRLDAGMRDLQSQLTANTVATKQAAASAAATEANTRDISEAWAVVQQVARGFEAIAKVVRPIARVVSAASWVAVRLGVLGGIGVGGWKVAGDWITSLLKWLSFGGKA